MHLSAARSRAHSTEARFHLFASGDGHGVLIADGSRIHRISDEIARLLDFAASSGRAEVADEVFEALGISSRSIIGSEPPASMPVRAFSLAIAQKCNLGCSYCYAEGGDFGGSSKSMTDEVSLKAVRVLFDGVQAGESIKLAFLGGEPFVNRAGLRGATELAVELARERAVRIAFSVTTNGTLLTEDDAEFLARHRFNVTVSLDGVGAKHDALRPFKDGRGSFERITDRLRPVLDRQDHIDLAARVTVTPRNLALLETLEGLVALGFRTVGFSPMLSSPAGRDEMSPGDLECMLEQMIACGEAFRASLLSGRPHAFSNLATALRELDRGTHRPYPCGAGAGYFGVSADGDLSACHRFVNEPAGAMGTLESGVDPARQSAWLNERHVLRQEPCQSCWARFLCGGGCHHEVIHRGRPACDYIRSWLTYCLGAYVDLREPCRWWFDGFPAGNA
ncbi:radical SAM/SPASM domain-containing protein [Methylobacterium frigidaeris]|uniref:GTP 3',8-cyclase n=1 Tax=Methylobacterium frigidaeris TaxID=2038277 RepID=A0AA37HIM5_9HYPH|nr:radical SAM protein [Methylobacterium frigidaeris]GJD66494.1 GTP 3',8-cyclase [Methylobacterium frigidaeris]